MRLALRNVDKRYRLVPAIEHTAFKRFERFLRGLYITRNNLIPCCRGIVIMHLFSGFEKDIGMLISNGGMNGAGMKLLFVWHLLVMSWEFEIFSGQAGALFLIRANLDQHQTMGWNKCWNSSALAVRKSKITWSSKKSWRKLEELVKLLSLSLEYWHLKL